MINENKIDVNCENEFKISLVHWASFNGFNDILKVLHEHKANFNTFDRKYGRSPLLHAANNCHSKTCELLLGFNVKLDDLEEKSGNSAIHLCSLAKSNFTDSMATAEVFLRASKGEIALRTNANDETALHCCSQSNNISVARLLVKFGFGKQFGNEESSKYLLAKTKDGETALDVAKRCQSYNMARFLVQLTNKLKK